MFYHSNQLGMEQHIVQKMMETLQLSSSEVSELCNIDKPITAGFFSALSKAQQIHQQVHIKRKL
jgi:plasmid maintenance system antidote protein VapI